jgi:hypothetical protein
VTYLICLTIQVYIYMAVYTYGPYAAFGFGPFNKPVL